MTNVTPNPAPSGPRAAMPPNVRKNLVVALGLLVLVIFIVGKLWPGENKYEKLAHQFTEAVQSNDVTAVAKLENAEIGAETKRTQVGAAADVLTPLGKVKSVKESTPSSDPPRVHEFDVTFQNGSVVHEKFLFDPNDKVFRFKYDPPVKNS